MAEDGSEGYPSREDRIVAEFGDGHDVEGIALRYGLTVEQVYAVIEREVGPAEQRPPTPPAYYPPPGQYPPPGYYGPPPPAPNYYYAPQPGQYPPPGQGYYGPPAYQAPPPGYAPPGYAPPGYAPPPPGYVPPPPGYAPPGYAAPPPGYVPPPLDEDAIVAEYGEGYDVEWIARKHGITAEYVYEVVLRVVDNHDEPE